MTGSKVGEWWRKERKPEHQVCTTSIGRPFVRSRIHFKGYNIENTLPKIHYREYTSKITLSRIRFREYNIENTLPRIQYRENTSKNTISRIHFKEYIIENTLQRIQCQICTIIRQILEYTSKDETHINNERGPRIQYQACTAISSNDSSDPRIHFTEYNF